MEKVELEIIKIKTVLLGRTNCRLGRGLDLADLDVRCLLISHKFYGPHFSRKTTITSLSHGSSYEQVFSTFDEKHFRDGF